MKISFLLIIAQLCVIANLHAQQVSGYTKDSQGNPVIGATVSLVKSADSSIVKLALSKDAGLYSFNQIPPGSYRVKATSVGYNEMISDSFSLDTRNIKVPDIRLKKENTILKEVTVTAQKQVVEVRADKTILNVEGTINSIGTDALELLRKSPGVSVDKDDNLSLSGKNGVQVYIDGRPTPLSGQDLANYLKSLQSSQIEAIEIITNPSAKYEAAGNAGIINIRLKKNKSYGLNGSANAGWNVGVYAKYNAGLSLNYRNSKINLFGNYSFNQGLNENRLSLNRTVLDTLFDQHGVVTVNNRSHNFKAAMDYSINKKNSIGVILNGTLSDPSVTNYGRTPIYYIPTGKEERLLDAGSTSTSKSNNFNFNLNYNYIDDKGKSLVVNADHGLYDLNKNQFQPNYYLDPESQSELYRIVYRMISPSTININSVKADWEQNYKKGKLGFGGKTAFVNSDNDFRRYNVYTSGDELDKDRSNRFLYKENINAAYINYNRQFKGVMIQAGLRVENTVSNGISSGQRKTSSGYADYDSSFKRSYTDFFPSAAISFNKHPDNQFSITYSRRIDRPNYQDLNPFESKLDEYTFQKGNINLRPQYTNSFGITHTYKYKLNTSLNYSHVKDLFTQLIDTADRSKAFLSKRNLASQDIVSLNVSYPFQYRSYSLFTNVNGFYTHYNANFGENRTSKLDAFALRFYAQNSLKFAKTWTAEITGFYNSPQVYQGTFKAKTLWSMEAGLQKSVMKGRANVKASLSDVFNTLHFSAISDFAGQKTNITSYFESRQFKINFIYRFGSNKIKDPRKHESGSEEENKRMQSGKGVMGQ